MGKYTELSGAIAVAVLLSGSHGFAQTPEQEKAWEAERARTAAEQKAAAERLAQQRAARKADPMAWVRTLDPMSSGGWEFRAVASDGSWATFSSTHQMKRSGQMVTIWLRQEYAEPQSGRRRSVLESGAEDSIRLQKGAVARPVGHLLLGQQYSGQ